MEVKKRLGDAELEIMMVLWRANEPVTSKYILEHLPQRRKWVLSSLMSSLAKLCEKGFVSCDRTYRLNLYTPLIAEDEYKAQEARTILTKMYDNSLHNFVTTLYNKNMIDKSDINELRQFLDKLDKDD